MRSKLRSHTSGNRSLRLDRMLTGSLWKQSLWIVCILILTWLVSYACLSLSGANWREFCTNHGIKPWLLPLYMLIDTNALSSLYIADDPNDTIHGWLLLVSSITYLIGLLIFNGIIISVLSNYIAQRRENYQNGLSRYKVSGHYIIMGYDEMVPSVISDIFRRDKEAHVLMLSAVPSDKIREHLRKSVQREYFDRILVNYGHRAAKEYYPDIHLEEAKEVYVVGNRSMPNHDAVNVECVESICAYLKEQPQHAIRRITCVFEDLDTYASFRTSDIFSDITKDLHLEFAPYNFYASWAKQVFIDRSYIGKKDNRLYAYPAPCRQGIGPNDTHYVHLVFVGMSNFAVTFANEAAHVLHFPNSEKARTRITFIDLHADREMPVFITRNHHFFEVQPYSYGDFTEQGDGCIKIDTSRLKFSGKDSNFLDVDFEFIKGDIYSASIQNLIYQWAKDEQQYLSLFLAMTNQRDNFAFAMNMPDAVYNNAVPVFVRQDSSDNFITLLRQADTKAPRKGEPEYRWYEKDKVQTKESHGRYAHLYPFGMNDTSFYSEETSLRRAKLINDLYNQKWGGKNWDELNVAEKWSNLYFAYGISYKLLVLRAMRGLDPEDTSHDKDPLTAAELEALGRTEHNRWNVEKLLMGYRKPQSKEDPYGKTEAVAKQLSNNKHFFIHPQIRPYEELTEEMKQLDIEFSNYIPWIIEKSE